MNGREERKGTGHGVGGFCSDPGRSSWKPELGWVQSGLRERIQFLVLRRVVIDWTWERRAQEMPMNGALYCSRELCRTVHSRAGGNERGAPKRGSQWIPVL